MSIELLLKVAVTLQLVTVVTSYVDPSHGAYLFAVHNPSQPPSNGSDSIKTYKHDGTVVIETNPFTGQVSGYNKQYPRDGDQHRGEEREWKRGGNGNAQVDKGAWVLQDLSRDSALRPENRKDAARHVQSSAAMTDVSDKDERIGQEKEEEDGEFLRRMNKLNRRRHFDAIARKRKERMKLLTSSMQISDDVKNKVKRVMESNRARLRGEYVGIQDIGLDRHHESDVASDDAEDAASIAVIRDGKDVLQTENDDVIDVDEDELNNRRRLSSVRSAMPSGIEKEGGFGLHPDNHKTHEALDSADQDTDVHSDLDHVHDHVANDDSDLFNRHDNKADDQSSLIHRAADDDNSDGGDNDEPKQLTDIDRWLGGDIKLKLRELTPSIQSGELFTNLQRFSDNPRETVRFEEPVMQPVCVVQKMLAEKYAFSPSCDENGAFTSKQCYLERCWCVDREGKPKDSNWLTRFFYKKDGVDLNCEQEQKENEGEGEEEEVKRASDDIQI